MASSVKIILRKKANKEGLYPLAIRITKNRKSRFIYTGKYINIKDWDEVNRKVRKSHPNSTRLNNYLKKKESEVSEIAINLETSNNDFSSKEIKKNIVKSKEKESFNSFSQKYLTELQENKKYSTLDSAKPKVNHFINFSKSDNLQFNEINEDLLRRFIIYLKTKRKNSERTIANNLIIIRSIYNKAIRAGIIEQKFYPFGVNKIQIKIPESKKVGLTKHEVKKIENLGNLTEKEAYAKDIWLLSFYLAGMRFADILKMRWSDIHDNRYYYKMNKNSKRLSIVLNPKANAILRKYKKNKNKTSDLIFQELASVNLEDTNEVLNKTKTANKRFNRNLKKIAQKANIEKKLTAHISRHTFGNIAGDEIPIQMLQKLYRHSSVTTTINYQSNFKHKESDEAIDKVTNF